MFIKKVLKQWLPLAVVIAALGLLAYTLAQQVYRMSANDPQIQMAEDGAAAISSGAAVNSIVPSGKVNIASSLAPFVIVLDDSGKVIASNADLRGQVPPMPAGVLDYVRTKGEDRVTMQPEPGVRFAAVITRFTGSSNGFVLAGRSLREVEIREDNLLKLSALAVVVTVVATLVVVILCQWIFGKRRKPQE